MGRLSRIWGALRPWRSPPLQVADIGVVPPEIDAIEARKVPVVVLSVVQREKIRHELAESIAGIEIELKRSLREISAYNRAWMASHDRKAKYVQRITAALRLLTEEEKE